MGARSEDSDDALIAALARTPAVAPFAGTERYQVRRCLGEGGFGVVFECDDVELGTRVALKTLKDDRPANLRRLKREFRSVADLVHPNLVALHELASDGARWFFTMDLLRGARFSEHVRGDEARLRAALPQLVAGVGALHDAGIIHRDLKPSNVVVEPDGRVVILDFGLAWVGDPEASMETAGTQAYMAPEQAAGEAATQASDWYAVGVMLYEALTGRRPFDVATPGGAIAAKLSRDPEPPSRYGAVPADLERLCLALLARAPAARPSAPVIRELLGDRAPVIAVRSRRDAERAHFVGRAGELATLRAAYAAVCRGEPAVVRICGQPGIGKSALLARFLDELAERGDSAVLAGRCHEREYVPFKAFDGIADALVRYLGTLPESDAAALMPRDIHLVTQLFPVLDGVAAVRSVPARKQQLDPVETRAKAFAALKELVARIADKQPLVIAIDDLQWGDVDSARLLAQLVAPPERAAMLLVACYRPDDTAAIGMLREGVEIALAPLPQDDAEQLAASLLGERAGDARTIAQRGDGHPLFMTELARALGRAEHTDGPPPTLLDILWQRVVELSGGARALLEAVAVAGRPLPSAVCFAATNLGAAAGDALRTLRAKQLVVTGDGGTIGVFHDRVREAVLAHLDDSERRVHHERLAIALEASGTAPPETLAIHWSGAGDNAKALAYARVAAAQAAQSLAFEHAARLYRRCLELLPPGSTEAATLDEQLGDVLASAGRGPEAARAYLAAAELTTGEAAVRLDAKAAGELLRSGHVDASIDVLRRVLAQLDLPLPATPRAALLSLLKQRALLRLRGLGFRSRAEAEVPARDLTRIDISWSLAVGFGFIDVIRGAAFQARHLRLALAAGEPSRVARALSLEVGYRFAAGTRGGDAAPRTLAIAEELAQRLGDPPHLAGLTALMTGIGGVCEGRWVAAEEACARAETIFRERCSGVGWELASAHIMRLSALWYLGGLRDIAASLPALLREAEDRGDLFAVTCYRTVFIPMSLLAADQPDAAADEGARALHGWSQRGFHFQHYFQLFAATQLHLYRGDHATAYRNAMAAWPALRASLLFTVQQTKIETCYFLARAELAHGRVTGDAALVKSALKRAKAIESERSGWGDGLALLVRAAADDLLGHRAEGSLERAIELLDAAHMHCFAAAARRRLGLVTDRPELVAAADQSLRDLGCANPARMAAMLVAGFEPK